LFVEKEPSLGPSVHSRDTDSKARVLFRSGPEMRLGVQATESGVLFIPEMYGKGWRATVDGRLAEVFRADGCFKAVALPPGDHVVRLWYLPVSFVVGAWVSGASLFLALAWWWLGRGRARRTE